MRRDFAMKFVVLTGDDFLLRVWLLVQSLELSVSVLWCACVREYIRMCMCPCVF